MTLPVTPPPLLESAGLDRERAQQALNEAVAGADDGELYLERSESESLLFDDGRLKSAAYDTGEGFGLRVVAGETTGYAHASEISEAAIGRAASSAAAAKRGYSGVLSEGPRLINTRLYGEDDVVGAPGFGAKVELLQEIDAYARALDPRVVQVSASVAGERRVVEILRPDGRLLRDVRPLVRLNVSVTVERDGRRETGSAGAGGRSGFEAWLAPERWQAQAREALRGALVNLEAIPAPAGEMDVVLGPGWTGVLLHEAVGHGLEGDFNRKGTSAFSGRMGQRVAAAGVTGHRRRHGPRPARLADHRRRGHAHQPHHADRGRDPGGLHARPPERASDGDDAHRQRPAPVLRPHAPDADDQHHHAGRERQAGGHDRLHQARPVRGELRRRPGGHHQRQVRVPVHEAYLIEDGKVTAPVKGATLIGDGPTALTNVSMIGDDFEYDPGIGVCGKGGQSVPVGIGQPSLKIGGLTVGGTAIS
jgi:TldD protein